MENLRAVEVVVVDINVLFLSIVVFMVNAVIVAIPAVIILTLVGSLVMTLPGSLFGMPVHHL